jgi:hypothetical protein
VARAGVPWLTATVSAALSPSLMRQMPDAAAQSASMTIGSQFNRSLSHPRRRAGLVALADDVAEVLFPEAGKPRSVFAVNISDAPVARPERWSRCSHLKATAVPINHH